MVLAPLTVSPQEDEVKVVNVKTYGGLAQAVAAGVVYCGRPSPLGNPFRLGKGMLRGSTIEKYRAWLWMKLQQGDPLVLAALRALNQESVLGCWCKPQPCHCDVIVRAWQWLQRQ